MHAYVPFIDRSSRIKVKTASCHDLAQSTLARPFYGPIIEGVGSQSYCHLRQEAIRRIYRVVAIKFPLSI